MKRRFVNSLLILLAIILVFIAIFMWQTTNADRQQAVFAYGTLKYTAVRSAVCLCWTPASPATLIGYRKEGLNIEPDEGSEVDGEIFWVSEQELLRLDKYEKFPSKYLRQEIVIDNQLVWVYILNTETER